jgi:hypothetical protein
MPWSVTKELRETKRKVRKSISRRWRHHYESSSPSIVAVDHHRGSFLIHIKTSTIIDFWECRSSAHHSLGRCYFGVHSNTFSPWSRIGKRKRTVIIERQIIMVLGRISNNEHGVPKNKNERLIVMVKRTIQSPLIHDCQTEQNANKTEFCCKRTQLEIMATFELKMKF